MLCALRVRRRIEAIRSAGGDSSALMMAGLKQAEIQWKGGTRCEFRKKAPRHVPENWLYHENELTGAEANQIIEEIMVIFTKQKITIRTAKQVLEDALEALDKEPILGERIVNGVIIRADQSSHEENGPDVRIPDGCVSQDEQPVCGHYSEGKSGHRSGTEKRGGGMNCMEN